MKKLLAIVMVVAMMFSMTIVASAAYDTNYSASVTYADGVATVIVSVDKVDSTGIGVVYGEGVTAKAPTLYSDFKTLTQAVDEDEVEIYYWTNVVNAAATDAAGNTYATIQGAGYVQADGAPIEVNGPAFQFRFECEPGTELIVVKSTTGDDVLAEGNIVEKLTVPDPSSNTTPAPTATPNGDDDDATPAPTDNDATQAPADTTQAPADTTQAPAGTTTAAPSGSANAAKTADVAPVAAMITLVVLAGAALVVLKKRATN